MAQVADRRVTELLAGRLCHELIGPIAAVANGVELLFDEGPDLGQEALTLVAESARRTSSRLQFYRFAYGFGGEGGVAGPPPFELAASYFATTKATCLYREAVRALTLPQQKLGCNLLLVGSEALARGGMLTLDGVGDGLQLDIAGETVRLAREQLEALASETPIDLLSTQTVQAYFTGVLAQRQGLRLVVSIEGPGRLRIASLAAAS
jgi:histidine phosphotransferase ChpT